MLHADLVNMPILSCGFKYALVLLDDNCNCSRVFVLKHKNDTVDEVKKWLPWYERQTVNTLKVFHCDRGGEFLTATLDVHFTEAGIEIELSSAYTPQANGAAERVNRSLLQRTRALLSIATLPAKDWWYALQHSCFLRNILPVTCMGQMFIPPRTFSETQACTCLFTLEDFWIYCFCSHS